VVVVDKDRPVHRQLLLTAIAVNLYVPALYAVSVDWLMTGELYDNLVVVVQVSLPK
jgi:hypothetical protein